MSKSLGKDADNKQSAAFSEKVALRYVERFEKLETPTKRPSPNETTNPLKKLKLQPVIKQTESGISIPLSAISEKVALKYVVRVEKLKTPTKIQSPNPLKKFKLQPVIKQTESRKSVPPPAILKPIQNKKFANVNAITSTFKLEKATRLRRMPRQFAKIIMHEKELPLRAMAKCERVDILNDSKMTKALSIQKPVILKEEVVDLTDDSWGLTVEINFAVINVIQQFDMEQCEDLLQEAKLLKSELVHFDQVTVTQPPRVFDPNSIPVIDLIEDSDTETDCKFVIQQSINNNNHSNLPIVTVSDCIDFILPIIYRFYKLCKLNKRIEDALIEANSSNVSSFTDDFSKKKISIGADLVRYLSKITILKFDFNNFIDTLYTSFKEKYKESQLEKTTFIAHLSSMVEKNRSYCKSDVSITIVDGIILLKDETEASVLSQQQLETLRKQLKQYQDIVLNQRRLMAAAFASHPELYDTLMFYPQSEIFRLLKD